MFSFASFFFIGLIWYLLFYSFYKISFKNNSFLFKHFNRYFVWFVDLIVCLQGVIFVLPYEYNYFYAFILSFLYFVIRAFVINDKESLFLNDLSFNRKYPLNLLFLYILLFINLFVSMMYKNVFLFNVSGILLSVFIPFNIFVIKKNMLLPKLSNVLIYLYCLIIFFLIFNQIKSILFFVPIFIYLFIEIFFYTYFAFKDKSIDGFYMYFADFNLSICDFYNKLKDKEKSEYIFIISKLFGFFVFLLLFISVIIRSEFVVYLSIFTLILSATVVYGFKSGRVKFVYENQKQQKLNKKLKRKK